MCINLLALQQPMARDLRMLTSALKIASDLERVGDHAVNIAQSAERLIEFRPITPEPELVVMARLSREMLSDALEAFIRGDAAAGREVCRRDDKVDALHRSMFRILLTHMMEDPHIIGAGMELFLVSRNLERVADLSRDAARHTAELGLTNIVFVVGDGAQGYAPAAPYHAIVVSAAAPAVPPRLLNQLDLGGRLVIPVGDLALQELMVYRRTPAGFHTHSAGPCRFVPLLSPAAFDEA